MYKDVGYLPPSVIDMTQIADLEVTAGTLALEYSYNTPNIVPGLAVYFDTVGMMMSNNMPF